MNAAPANKTVLVVGLGATGASAVRFLTAEGHRVRAVDSRAAPPNIAALRRNVPDADLRTGGFDPAALDGVDELLVSPGVDLDEPLIVQARSHGLRVLGDIEWFARRARAPVVGVTGSNGKSTVTALLGEMVGGAGYRVAVGGNFGTPALDLLDPSIEIYVLELSSFQLELTESLAAAAAVVLNVSPDHIDRHASLEHYAALKARIYQDAGVAVVNGDDPKVAAMATGKARRVVFGADAGDWHLAVAEGDTWLCREQQRLLAAAQLELSGRHNLLNALAALALGHAVGLDLDAMLAALCSFAGLPHRCRHVATVNGVDWFNDSKATNVGAMLAALEGLEGPIVLLAGGQAKGADFTAVGPLLADKGRAAILFGADAGRIADVVRDHLPVARADNLRGAVQTAAQTAQPGDRVLLSPGCASFDQFRDYADRGEQFVAAVRELAA